MTPSVAASFDHLLDCTNSIVQVQMILYFYTAWGSCRLVPANKVHTSQLPPGTIPDTRPVNIGGSERRLISGANFDDSLQDSYNKILKLV